MVRRWKFLPSTISRTAETCQLFVDGLALGDASLVDLIQEPRAQRPYLCLLVEDAFRRHLAVPARVEEDETLRMLNEETEHGQPYPLAFRSGHTRSLQQAAVITAKGR